MIHTHKTHNQVLGFLAGVLLIAGTLGGVQGMFGKSAIEGVGALPGRVLTSSEEKMVQSAQKRRLRREKRMEHSERVISDIGKVYPMQVSSLLLQNQSEKLGVTLETGFLSYPSLNIAAPIGKPSLTQWKSRNWRGLEDQMQFGLLHGVVAYPHSPEAGARGNIILAGHSAAPTLDARKSAYQDVFASLPDAKEGDRIEVRGPEGETFIYEVYETNIVPPTETSLLLQDMGKKEITLFTCYPVGTTRERFVVRAKLVEGESVATR